MIMRTYPYAIGTNGYQQYVLEELSSFYTIMSYKSDYDNYGLTHFYYKFDRSRLEFVLSHDIHINVICYMIMKLDEMRSATKSYPVDYSKSLHSLLMKCESVSHLDQNDWGSSYEITFSELSAIRKDQKDGWSSKIINMFKKDPVLIVVDPDILYTIYNSTKFYLWNS